MLGTEVTRSEKILFLDLSPFQSQPSNQRGLYLSCRRDFSQPENLKMVRRSNWMDYAVSLCFLDVEKIEHPRHKRNSCCLEHKKGRDGKIATSRSASKRGFTLP